MSRHRPLRPEEREIWTKVARHVTPLPGKSVPARPTSAGQTPTAHSRSTPDPGSTAGATGAVSAPVGAGAGRAHHKKAVTGSTPKRLAPAKPKRPPPPVDRSTEKRVRRGQVEIDGRLDLHGLTQAEAEAALKAFVQRGAARGARCLLVITGKGWGEDAAGEYLPWWREAPGVIKRRCPEWLASPELAPLVSGTARAHQRHGGDGALYVFLRVRPGVGAAG